MTEVSEDALLDGRVRLCQPRSGYRVAVDTVLLAAAVPARPGQRILDLGCGVGGAALCLARRVPDLHLVGLEVQPILAGLARDNARHNGLAERFAVVDGDVAAPPPALAGEVFDHVLLNPPYFAAGTPPADAVRARAHVEDGVPLERWLATALDLVKPRGTVTLIHRADRLDGALAALAGRAGGVVLYPLWAHGDGRDAKRVLVQARRDIRAPARLAAGLVLHGPDGAFTPAAEAILRAGAALDLAHGAP